MRLLILPIAFAILLFSCEQNNVKQKELELQEKELNLKEKELALKEKELSLNSVQQSKPVTNKSVPVQNDNSKKEPAPKSDEFTIGVFEKIPNNIGCKYSTSSELFKNKKYLFLQKVANGTFAFDGAYIFINGKTETLTFLNYANTKGGGEIQYFSNDSYKVSLEVTHRDFDKLTVMNKTGKTITKNIYTECGD